MSLNQVHDMDVLTKTHLDFTVIDKFTGDFLVFAGQLLHAHHKPCHHPNWWPCDKFQRDAKSLIVVETQLPQMKILNVFHVI